MNKRKLSLTHWTGMYLLYALTLFLTFPLVLSCSSSAKEADWYGGEAMAMEEYEEPAPEMSRSAMKLEGAAQPVPLMDITAENQSLPASSPAEDPEPGSQRKRIYNGSAGLVVEDPPETRKALEDLAIASGGYVEQSYADYLVLRVPAEQFDSLFKEVLGMGKIRYQQIDTWDVTDRYQDTQARLKTAEETRKRLYVLLERSTDPKERARILREIGRLTEEIESIRQQLQILDSRIAFSRINVELIPRLQEDAYRQEIPFPWIASLSPLSPVSSRLETSVKLNPGDEYAEFSKEDVYIAENAYGTNITVSSVENSPEGDSAFWRKALLHHLGDYYASAAPKDLVFGSKEMPGVEFVSKDREPFRYFVGLIVENRKIHVVEIFSSDADTDFSPLYKALEEGEIR